LVCKEEDTHQLHTSTQLALNGAVHKLTAERPWSSQGGPFLLHFAPRGFWDASLTSWVLHSWLCGKLNPTKTYRASLSGELCRVVT